MTMGNLQPVNINPFFLEICLSLSLSSSLSLYLSSRYDRRHRPLYGNISYEGSGMSLRWSIRLKMWFRFLARTGGLTDEGVPRGPRGPKKEAESLQDLFANHNNICLLTAQSSWQYSPVTDLCLILPILNIYQHTTISKIMLTLFCSLSLIRAI